MCVSHAAVTFYKKQNWKEHVTALMEHRGNDIVQWLQLVCSVARYLVGNEVICNKVALIIIWKCADTPIVFIHTCVCMLNLVVSSGFASFSIHLSKIVSCPLPPCFLARSSRPPLPLFLYRHKLYLLWLF